MKKGMKILWAVGMTAMVTSVMLLTGCNKDDDSAPAVSNVTLSTKLADLYVGDTLQLKYSVSPAGALVEKEEWSTSNSGVATVSKGLVTCVAEGRAAIYITVNGKFTDSCVVTVEEQDPVYPEAPDSACININGIWWAPVNCGFHKDDYKLGKLYQWGRKDGSGYSGIDKDTLQKNVDGPIAASLEKAAEYYMVYYSDWLSTPDSTRWNSNKVWPGKETSPVKTKYDPCPDGWRVPTYVECLSLMGGENELDSEGWDSEKVGYWFNGTDKPKKGEGLFFPAAGYRGIDDGAFYSRGEYGYYWTSSVYKDEDEDEEKAYELGFGDNFCELDDVSRGWGEPVRCVKE